MSDTREDPPAAAAEAPPSGVTLRLHVFGLADQELTDVITPPWPQWMLRLYELEALHRPQVDVAGGDVGLSAALGALKERLARRLDILAWVCATLEREPGWELTLHGADIFAHKASTAEEVRRFLEDSRLAAVLPRLCETDDGGFPQLFSGRAPGARGDV
jgi:hypothetical protein